jgi:hypothetical protein
MHWDNCNTIVYCICINEGKTDKWLCASILYPFLKKGCQSRSLLDGMRQMYWAHSQCLREWVAPGVSICAIPCSKVSCDGFHINNNRSWPCPNKSGSCTLGPPHEVQDESAELPTSWDLWAYNCRSLNWPSMYANNHILLLCYSMSKKNQRRIS